MNINVPNTTSADLEQENESDLAVVPAGVSLAIERAAVDGQVATAHQYPRSVEKFIKRAMDMVSNDPDTAEACHYTRPVGKDKNGVMKYAEGPSIRAAEIVAACYGNLRVKAFITEQTERYVRAEGQAWDLESNMAASVQGVEATVYSDTGRPYKESQRTLIAKALLAKVYRDAVFKVVPRALFKRVMDTAKRVAAGDVKTLEDRRSKIQAWIGTLKMANAEERVLAAMGVSGWSEVGTEQMALLNGLRTAIRDQEMSYEEAFPVLPVKTQPHTAPVSGNPPANTPLQGQTQAAQTPPSGAPAQNPPSAPPQEPQKGAAVEQKPKRRASKAAPTSPETTSAGNAAPEGTGEESFEAAAATPPPQGQNPAPTDSDATTGTVTAAPTPAAPVDFIYIDDPSKALADLRSKIIRDNVLERQVISYLRSTKFMRQEQKELNELATIKINKIRETWENIIGSVRQQPV